MNNFFIGITAACIAVPMSIAFDMSLLSAGLFGAGLGALIAYFE